MSFALDIQNVRNWLQNSFIGQVDWAVYGNKGLNLLPSSYKPKTTLTQQLTALGGSVASGTGQIVGSTAGNLVSSSTKSLIKTGGIPLLAIGALALILLLKK